MHYKTLVLALLEQRPTLYHALRTRKTLLPTLDTYAHALKACHRTWMQTLAQTRPETDTAQRQSEALERSLADLQEALPPELSAHATLSLTFRTLFHSSEAILTEPPAKRGGRAIPSSYQTI